MKVPFKYYLHDGYEGSERESFIADQVGVSRHDEAFWEKVGRPFYEVTLECTLDTETGEVELVRASL